MTEAFAVALLGALCAGCGGGGGSDDDAGSSPGTPSSTSNTATGGSMGTAAATSSGGGTGSDTVQTALTSTAISTTGAADPWVCLEVSGGCLCSKIPGSEGEIGPCATTYSCCYGLEGSTCYCIEAPAEMCDEIIDVGYERYDSCPPP